MVEMLGVLAIIGVLSVAGIAGYSMAMRNYRANEIVNAASMFYVLAKAQNQGNGPTENITYENVGGTNPSGATLAYTDNAFTITFDDTDDCTMAANKLGDKATADCANKTLTVNFGEESSGDEGTDQQGGNEQGEGEQGTPQGSECEPVCDENYDTYCQKDGQICSDHMLTYGDTAALCMDNDKNTLKCVLKSSCTHICGQTCYDYEDDWANYVPCCESNGWNTNNECLVVETWDFQSIQYGLQ